MSQTAVERNERGADEDDLCHVVCEACREALCGGGRDDRDLLPEGKYDNDCLVCDDLDRIDNCVRCGAPAPRGS